MTFGSLFSGIGGLDLGLERAGMVCKWQVEIDDYATRVLDKHWPDVRRLRDIKTFPPEPTDEWQVDLICGGFPCQDISYAGKGAGLNGERSGLFYEAIRVVRVLGPRYVLLENVSALLTRGLDAVLGTLASLGYDAEWHCIQAADVGAPHIRDRVFVIAYANDSRSGASRSGVNGNWKAKDKGRKKPQSEPCGYCGEVVAHANGVGCGGSNNVSDQSRRTEVVWTGQDLPNWPLRIYASAKDASRKLGQFNDQWITEPDVGRVAHGVPARVDRLRCLGNAVVPQVAEFIGRMILDNQKAAD